MKSRPFSSHSWLLLVALFVIVCVSHYGVMAAEVEAESETPLPKEIAMQVVTMMKSKKAIGAKQSSAINILKWSADRAEKAVDAAAGDGESAVGDAASEAGTEISTAGNTGIERELSMQSNQRSNVKERTEMEAEDLRRKTDREKWEIGIAEQRAQVRLADTLDRAEKLDYDLERLLRFHERTQEKLSKQNEQELDKRIVAAVKEARETLSTSFSEADTRTKERQLKTEASIGEYQAKAEQAADDHAHSLADQEARILGRIRAAIDIASMQRLAQAEAAKAHTLASVGRVGEMRLDLAESGRWANRNSNRAEINAYKNLRAVERVGQVEALRLKTAAARRPTPVTQVII